MLTALANALNETINGEMESLYFEINKLKKENKNMKKTINSLMTNRYLNILINRAMFYKDEGYSGMDVYTHVSEEDNINEYNNSYLENLSFEDRNNVIKTLTNLGFYVVEYPDYEEQDFIIDWSSEKEFGMNKNKQRQYEKEGKLFYGPNKDSLFNKK